VIVRILFVGDIVGKPGRDMVRRAVPALVAHHAIDLVIANVENAAGGFGITRETGDEILRAGVDVMTSGNHIWDKKEALAYVAAEPRLLRPLNYAAGAPGSGVIVVTTRSGHAVAVVNAMGRVHMPLVDDPFAAISKVLDGLRPPTSLVFVDFHAEATSEKLAFGWHVDGRVTAVAGTHTHVQTADDQILPGGTAYITDAGMTGPHDSIIGVEKEAALARFLTGLPSRFDTASGNPKLHGVIVEADAGSGRALGITRLSLTRDDLATLTPPPPITG
jgi:metallophosphoesterase (TIGR00282 family)